MGAERRSPRGGTAGTGQADRGAKSFWRQVLMEMPDACSSKMTSGMNRNDPAITKYEFHYAYTMVREELDWIQSG